MEDEKEGAFTMDRPVTKLRLLQEAPRNERVFVLMPCRVSEAGHVYDLSMDEVTMWVESVPEKNLRGAEPDTPNIRLLRKALGEYGDGARIQYFRNGYRISIEGLGYSMTWDNFNLALIGACKLQEFLRLRSQLGLFPSSEEEAV